MGVLCEKEIKGCGVVVMVVMVKNKIVMVFPLQFCQEYKHMYMTQVSFNYYNEGYYDLHVMTPIE